VVSKTEAADVASANLKESHFCPCLPLVRPAGASRGSIGRRDEFLGLCENIIGDPAGLSGFLHGVADAIPDFPIGLSDGNIHLPACPNEPSDGPNALSDPPNTPSDSSGDLPERATDASGVIYRFPDRTHDSADCPNAI
jgi:hypothetical protein